MTVRTVTTWRCIAPLVPPHHTPCDAAGTTQASAERHTAESGHPTMTSTTPEGKP